LAWIDTLVIRGIALSVEKIGRVAGGAHEKSANRITALNSAQDSLLMQLFIGRDQPWSPAASDQGWSRLSPPYDRKV